MFEKVNMERYKSNHMSQDQDIMFFDRDVAFRTASGLAGHILETANGFHVLSEDKGYVGRERLKLGLLLLMLEESGKLMTMVRELEKAAKADYQSVRMEGLDDNCTNGQKALAQIMEEVKIVGLASEMLGKKVGKAPEQLEQIVPGPDFCSFKNAALYYSFGNGPALHVPSERTMDRYAQVIERNALSAGDYIHELGMALGIWIELELRSVASGEGGKERIRYG